MKKQRTTNASALAAVRAQARQAGLAQGPGQFNPNASVRFTDRKKAASKKAARGRVTAW